MRSLARLTIAVLLAVTGALAACGDDGGSGTDIGLEDREGEARDDSDDTDDSADDDDTDDTDEQDDTDDELPAEAEPYIEALTAAFAGDESLPIPEDQARCIATNIVGIIRLERLAEAESTPEEFADDIDLSTLGLEPAEGLAIMDAFGECDFDFYDALLTSFSAEATDPAVARACMEAAVTPEQLRETMARGFVEGDAFEDSPESEAVFGPLFACSFGETDG